MPIQIFFSYASESDKDKAVLDELKKEMSTMRQEELITIWSRDEIDPGEEIEATVERYLNEADIIILLVSPDFINTDNCFDKEMQRAMERHNSREAHVIPVMLRPVDIKDTPFKDLKRLPEGDKPITSWENRDKALLNVVEGIRKVMSKVTPAAPVLPSPRVQRSVGLRPPTDPGTISQRERDVRYIYEQLTQRKLSALVLTGLDGIGKSTLAALVYNYVGTQLHEHAGFFAARPVWIKINRTTKMSDIASVLFKILGKEKDFADFHRFSPEYQAQALFDALNTARKPFLIVLDQFDYLLDPQTGQVFAECPGLEEWLEVLNNQQCRHCRILITSRHFPDFLPNVFIQKCPLSRLDNKCSIEMLRKQGVEVLDEDMRTVVEKCRGIPLALNLLVRVLHTRNLSLHEFLNDPECTHYWQGNVADNLAESIYKDLNVLQRTMLGAFSIYREAVTLDAAQAVLCDHTCFSDDQIQEALDVILTRNLLIASDGLYQVQTFIDNYMQKHMSGKNRVLDPQCAHRCAAEYYLQHYAPHALPKGRPESVEDAHAFIEATWHFCQAGQWVRAYKLLFEGEPYAYLKLWGKNAVLLELLLLFLPTERWCPDDWLQKVRIYKSLGEVYSLLGKKEKALEYYPVALDMAKQRGDLQEEGIILRHIGRVYNALGEKKKALEYLNQALSILISSKANGREIGETYIYLGRVSNVLEQKEQAKAFYKEALKTFEALESSTRYEEIEKANGRGTALSYLGRVYGTLGDREQGLSCCEQGLSILRDTKNRRGEGRALDNLGRVYAAAGEYNEARKVYNPALHLTRQIGDRGGEGLICQDLANAYAALRQQELADKRYERAIRFQSLAYGRYKQALRLLIEVGDKWREGMTLSSLADLCAASGDEENALKYYKRAISKRKEIEDYEGTGKTYYSFGLFHLHHQNYEIALACFLMASQWLKKALSQGQDIPQSGLEELQKAVGDEQFAVLLKRVEPQTLALADKAFYS